MPRSMALSRAKTVPAAHIADWWKQLLEVIEGKRVVVPHVSFNYLSLVGNREGPITEASLVKSVVITFRVPYNRDKGIEYDYSKVLASLEKLKVEVERFGRGSDLEDALRRKDVRLCKLRLIDAGRTKRGGPIDAQPRVIAESRVIDL